MQASPLFARYLPAELFGGGGAEKPLPRHTPNVSSGRMADDEVTLEADLAAQVAVARAELAEVRALLLRLAADLPPRRPET